MFEQNTVRNSYIFRLLTTLFSSLTLLVATIAYNGKALNFLLRDVIFYVPLSQIKFLEYYELKEWFYDNWYLPQDKIEASIKGLAAWVFFKMMLAQNLKVLEGDINFGKMLKNNISFAIHTIPPSSF